MTPSIITPAASTITIDVTVTEIDLTTTTESFAIPLRRKNVQRPRGYGAGYPKNLAHKGVDASVYPRETASAMYPTDVRCAVLVEIQDMVTRTATASVPSLIASTVRTTAFVTVTMTRYVFLSILD